MIKKQKWSSFLILGVFAFQASFTPGTLAQDLIPPENVENVNAEAGNQFVTLTWNKATDPDGEIIGYKVYYGTQSVTAENGNSYEDEIIIDDSFATKTVINGLVNNVEYYFALTAIDDEEEESLNYSREISATPKAPIVNNPTVIKASPGRDDEIIVIMSKSIQVGSKTQSFIIDDITTGEEVMINDLKILDKQVSIEIDQKLTPGHTYDVLATSSVTDLLGNPVSSGITDHFEFHIPDGHIFNTHEVVQKEDVIEEVVEEPEIKIEVEDTREEEIDLDTSLQSLINNAIEPEIPEEVIEEVVEEVVEITEPVIEEAKEEIKEELHSAPTDITAPEKAAEIEISLGLLEKEGVILTSWKKASDKDLIDQILYIRENGVDWGDGYSLGTNIQEVELEVDTNTSYEVKIESVDKSGNKSTSETKSFSTKLAQSGSSSVVALMVAILFGAYFVRRRQLNV